jgi:hypothetical protein
MRLSIRPSNARNVISGTRESECILSHTLAYTGRDGFHHLGKRHQRSHFCWHSPHHYQRIPVSVTIDDSSMRLPLVRAPCHLRLRLRFQNSIWLGQTRFFLTCKIDLVILAGTLGPFFVRSEMNLSGTKRSIQSSYYIWLWYFVP